MIQKYLEYLQKPRLELDGHPICPYAKKFIENISVWNAENMVESVKKYVNNFPVNKKVIILIADPKKYSIEELQTICDENQTDKLWLVPDHPNQYNEIGGVKTNNEDYAMILIQDREELKKYSDKLQKTSYYNFWSEEYYK
ncbi:hypothetical protein [Okeania sp.]|uniref:hypothetical protein n=1 Tax=Okeania sp. TaxID=3100323 RepID=UPI002B4B51B9|nr:hypothetical protein [Okeania sp.]MEB3339834.1 hypothetical protein [Okeania sp.]